MPAIIDYYFAAQSPWSYFGQPRFTAMVARHGATVRIKPADMARVFAASGGKMLAQRPAQRQAYRLVELRRYSDWLGMPLNLHPKYFPVSGDPAALLIIATLHRHDQATTLALTTALMRAVWVEEKNISDPATLADIATQCGLDGAALVAASAEPAVQAEYVRNTDDAIAAQVFGAPTWILNDEPFWGQDRLDFLERALAAHTG